jgi:hypothetical protein
VQPNLRNQKNRRKLRKRLYYNRNKRLKWREKMPKEEEIDISPGDFEEECTEYLKDQECLKMYMRADIPADFYLMHLNAWKYLKKGDAKCRIKDYFEISDSPFDEAEFKKGCEQILEWWGLNEKNPFRLSISSMNNLMLNFYFQMIEQKAIAQDSDSILDHLIYEHQIDKSKIVLYNLVHY